MRAPRPLRWLAVASVGGLLVDVARGLDAMSADVGRAVV